VDAKIGVLALQGNVSEHVDAFRRALENRGFGTGSEVVTVSRPGDLTGCDALAIPGGESTTISRLIGKNGLFEPVRTFSGGVFATCAGMVLAATCVDDRRIKPLGLIGMTVDRNAFGRQKESFEADLTFDGVPGGAFHAIFIRAPVVTCVDPDVRVLAEIDQGIVAVEKGKHVALSFHPELGCDFRLHERFLKNLGI
jgi:pyridoxal 5'-phosphate synthase pdxT subunit